MCRCRKAKRHNDCAYCGMGGDGIRICGRCSQDGIDGPIIRGTSSVTCSLHSRAAEKGGLKPGELNIQHVFPSTGKSMFDVHAAAKAASRKADAESGKSPEQLKDENAHFAKLRVTRVGGRFV